jgi:hypothetical protein
MSSNTLTGNLTLLNGNPWILTTPSSTGVYTSASTHYQPYTSPATLVYFKIGDKSKIEEDILNNTFSDIIKNEFLFSPRINGKKLEPLELILKYIKDKVKFHLKLVRCGYEIELMNVYFIELSNILSNESDTVLKVKFEYEKMFIDNTLLSKEEKRTIKVKELIKRIK